MFERLRNLLGLEQRGLQIHRATDYGRDILVNSPDGWEHDQQWFWWIDGPGSGTPNGFGNPPPGARFSGAEALPSVLRCTALVADTLAGLPWRVYRGYDQQSTPDWLSDPQATRPDGRRPDSVIPDPLSHVEFWTQWIVSALWFGDGFAYAPMLRADSQPQVPLLILDPQRVEIAPTESAPGYGLFLRTDEGDWVALDPQRTLRLRGEPPYANGKLGLGVIERFSDDLGLVAAMRAYASSIFTNGIPSGYLKVNAPVVTEQQADKLQTRWMGRHGSPRKKVAVLNANTDFVPLTISPVDAGLDTAKTWGLRDIALAFGVPPYMLGVPGDTSTYANVESRMTEFRTFTLLPWMRRIEAALDARFPRGTEVKINAEGTLRADPSTRFDMYASAITEGWMTVDEVRALEDRPPLPTQVTTDPEPSAPELDALEDQERWPLLDEWLAKDGTR